MLSAVEAAGKLQYLQEHPDAGQTMWFNQPQDLTFGPVLDLQPGQNDIRTLPMFFRADLEMVRRQGGPFLRHALERLPLSGRFKYLSIDTRTHMLMPKWYACIPGWHCDDFHRGPDGQPDLENVAAKAPMMHHSVVFGNTAFTEYAVEPLDLPAPRELPNPEDRPLYSLYHQLIEKRQPAVRAVQSGEVVTFGPLVFHRGVPATRAAWRYFLRATESDHWHPVNEIRTQTQVYLTDEFHVW